MFKLLGFVMKTVLFSLVVIVLANSIHFGGRTISDHVRTGLSHAERLPLVDKIPGEAKEMKDWVGKKAGHVFHTSSRHLDSSEIHVHQAAALRPRAAIASSSDVREATTPTEAQTEAIPASERQKLKALIRELNSAQN